MKKRWEQTHVTHNLAIAVCSIRRVYTSNDAATLYNNRFKTISLIICSFRIPSFYLTLASCSFLFGGPFECPFPLSPPLLISVFLCCFLHVVHIYAYTSWSLHRLIEKSNARKLSESCLMKYDVRILVLVWAYVCMLKNAYKHIALCVYQV